MKTKYVPNKTVFNFRVNQEEYLIVKTLREKHAINISGAFKIFLRDMLKKMENRP